MKNLILALRLCLDANGSLTGLFISFFIHSHTFIIQKKFQTITFNRFSNAYSGKSKLNSKKMSIFFVSPYSFLWEKKLFKIFTVYKMFIEHWLNSALKQFFSQKYLCLQMRKLFSGNSTSLQRAVIHVQENQQNRSAKHKLNFFVN